MKMSTGNKPNPLHYVLLISNSNNLAEMDVWSDKEG